MRLWNSGLLAMKGPGATSAPGGMVGRSAALRATIDLARRIAPTLVPALVVGETGTGKELLAQFVHEMSGRPGPFIDVDCGAIPDELMESLLFGHRRGAFTGAVQSVRGLISEADQGTLFLDELASMSPTGQAKLLRVLETRQVRRVGARRPTPVDFRLISTVQTDVRKAIDNGSFRPDLLQRISGMVIRVPPLVERLEDIPLLARHFARRQSADISDEAVAMLAGRDWPGNVRELKWTVVRAALFAIDGVITPAAVEGALEAGPARFLNGATQQNDRFARLRSACLTHAGDAERIADALGIGRSTLYRRLKDAGLELRSFKGVATA